MKYLVPLYKIDKNIQMLGKIIVEKTSLGVFDIISGEKLKVTSEFITSKEIKKNLCFIKIKDLNCRNLVIQDLKNKNIKISENKVYNRKKYQSEYQKIKQHINTVPIKNK